jgi:ribose-phosphate pyrophosphokinase
MYKKLNLTDITASDIKYKISKFPDGQQTVDIEWVGNTDSVVINSRMNSFLDVELIVCANQALKNAGVKNVGLHVPYFLGARSDRKFQEGGSNYLKQVICPIINSQNFFTVIVLDPHSDVLEACLNNYEKIDNHLLVKQALTLIDNKNDARERVCLVSPDAGAYKKIFDVAQEFRIDNIATATKVRDLKTGKILHTEIPNLPVTLAEDFKYVIVDDICDGGRTFVELAKAIREQRPTAKIYLVVTHGIFSSGFEALGEYFEATYTTNSVKEQEDTDLVTRFNVFG